MTQRNTPERKAMLLERRIRQRSPEPRFIPSISKKIQTLLMFHRAEGKTESQAWAAVARTLPPRRIGERK